MCKKRFTRSDLLNRHRRIHSATTALPEGSRSHVTQLQLGSVPLPPNPLFERAVSQDDSRSSTPQDEILPDQLQPRPSVQHNISNLQPEGYLSGLNRSTYQPQYTMHNPLIIPPQSEGLTNLMEAALAPQEQFSPIRHMNQPGWDAGYFGTGRNDGNLPMGAFDGDMSWVMESFNAESLSNYSSDYDMCMLCSIAAMRYLLILSSESLYRSSTVATTSTCSILSSTTTCPTSATRERQCRSQ